MVLLCVSARSNDHLRDILIRVQDVDILTRLDADHRLHRSRTVMPFVFGPVLMWLRGALAVAVLMDAGGTALAVLVVDGSVKATLATTTIGAAVVAGVAEVESAVADVVVGGTTVAVSTQSQKISTIIFLLEIV